MRHELLQWLDKASSTGEGPQAICKWSSFNDLTAAILDIHYVIQLPFWAQYDIISSMHECDVMPPRCPLLVYLARSPVSPCYVVCYVCHITCLAAGHTSWQDEVGGGSPRRRGTAGHGVGVALDSRARAACQLRPPDSCREREGWDAWVAYSQKRNTVAQEQC